MTLYKQSLLIIAAILISCTANAQRKKVKANDEAFGNNKATGHYLNTRGIKLYYEIYSKGEPLLIMHANGGSINNFKGQIPYFAKNYQVILADSRAQGKTVDKADSLSYEMMADDMNALLDSLHLKQCYVIGWSDGSINALLMAMRHPDKVEKMVITGANLCPDTTALEPYVFNMISRQNKALADSVKKVKSPSAELKNEVKLWHMLAVQPNIKAEELRKIQAPVLVIGGDHDVVKPEHALLIAKSIPNAYLWIIPGAGHATPVYHEQEFNKTVEEFFKKPYQKIEGRGMLK
ncbi:alpha/beta fold hydrolase [Mucilaginibacter terrae]|uniref:Pimeloyl-ACP methyl ester carboxylesterase n=1 Tax=Mucilaginibacter terrae TaxID=1955052 RepID=A0ABU3GV29_9SPHI|nr:alpha/beta hydrolase [Mucilaginibacter terrae]MDT3403326.1 pimeloyl-ACP methyl ester carboxylesterase [Mucilaginibacter terrae]